MMENTVWLAKTDAGDLSAAVRVLLARALGFTPTLAKDENGKPWLPAHPELHISLSHTRGAVACAVSACPVGVDLERIGRRISPALAKRCFTDAERIWAGEDPIRLISVWTRKEAILKWDGRGVRLPLCTVETTAHAQLVTQTTGDFVLSFCGEPAAFVLTEMNLE